MSLLHYIPGTVRTAVILAAAILVCVQISPAQSDLENVLKQYDAATIEGYIQPMADLFGANINSSVFPSAAIPTTGLSIRFAIVAMGAVVGDDQKNYTLALPPSFAQRTMRAPTVFGPRATLVRDPDTGLEFRPSDGIIDATLFPLAVPQLSVGSIFGTEATVRFIITPSIGDNKFPKTTLWGIGARHSISQYLPAVPVDIAVGLFYSSFTVGDIIDFTGVTIGAQAGKSFGIANVHGGLSWEKSTMNLSYMPSAAGSPAVNLDLDGENTVRFTAGAGLSLGVLSLFADANFGAITNFSGGVGVGF